jgi:hypothetical protein
MDEDEKTSPEHGKKLTSDHDAPPHPYSLIVELETTPLGERQAQDVLADALIALAAHLRATDLSPAALMDHGFPEQPRPPGTTHARWLISSGSMRALAKDPL